MSRLASPVRLTQHFLESSRAPYLSGLQDEDDRVAQQVANRPLPSSAAGISFGFPTRGVRERHPGPPRTTCPDAAFCGAGLSSLPAQPERLHNNYASPYFSFYSAFLR